MKHAVKITQLDESYCDNVIVDWNLGNTCNYRCSYCPDALHDGSIPWLPYEKVTRFCEQLIEHFVHRRRKRLFIQFTGGEPTMYPHFLPLTQLLNQRKVQVCLISNGSRTLRWWNQAAEHLTSIILTFHVEFADLDHFRAVVKLLVGLGKKIHINVTMLPAQFQRCYDVATSLTQIENVTLSLKPLLVDFGDQMVSYDRDQLEILNQPLDVRINQDEPTTTGPRGLMKTVFSDGTIQPTRATQLVVNQQNRWQGWMCNAGLEILSISPDGQVWRGVCRQGGVIGSVRHARLDPPLEPVRCSKPVCHCLLDISATKQLQPE